MAKQERKETEASKFLGKGASPVEKTSDVSKTESADASAVKKAGEPGPKADEASKVEQAKPEAKAKTALEEKEAKLRKLPRKFHKFVQ